MPGSDPRKTRLMQGPSQDKKLGRAGLRMLSGKKKKEDSSVTLGKFMKAKVDALNESVKDGGMKADRVIEGSNMRRKKDFRKDVEAGKYKEPSKDAAYYKSIGLTSKRGDKAVEDFFKPQKFSKGGRAGYKMGSKCKLATKGKGRAYGKNS
jgi:hypothetical protein